MKVSVLVPIYKTKSEYLRAAILSVLNQTFRDFELVLLDDCPSDSHESVVKEFSDPRIKYYKNEQNLGISKSRNKLIDLSQGEYLAIFDHDDVCRPTRLEKEVKYLDEHPECGVVGSWMNLMPQNREYRAPETDIRATMLNYCCIWHSSSMIRKSLLVEHHIRYNELYSPAEDYGLFMHLMPHTELYNLQEVLVDYRVHESNTSTLQPRGMRKGDCLVKMWAKANLSDEYNNFLLQANQVTRVKLFGVPLLKIRATYDGYTIHLFNFIKILSVHKKGWKID